MKNWKESIIEALGIFKTDENGHIIFTPKQFGDKIKYTATLIVADDSPFAVLARRNTWVFIDGIRQSEVDAFRTLEAQKIIDAHTKWVASGHLIRSEGRNGLNDLYNLKSTGFRLAKEDEKLVVNFDEALTRSEWQTIKEERRNGTGSTEAPSAPEAPIAPIC